MTSRTKGIAEDDVKVEISGKKVVSVTLASGKTIKAEARLLMQKLSLVKMLLQRIRSYLYRSSSCMMTIFIPTQIWLVLRLLKVG